MSEFNTESFVKRMDGAISALKKEFMGLRSGRAHSGLIETIYVDVYGQKTPISQLGTISVPEPRMLSLQVWDKANIDLIDKAIRNSHLGINPMVSGQVLRLPVPPLSEERRIEFTKIANQYSEQARIAVRNIRRDAMDQLKKTGLSEDEQKLASHQVQNITDEHITNIDRLLSQKKEEILNV